MMEEVGSLVYQYSDIGKSLMSSKCGWYEVEIQERSVTWTSWESVWDN